MVKTFLKKRLKNSYLCDIIIAKDEIVLNFFGYNQFFV